MGNAGLEIWNLNIEAAATCVTSTAGLPFDAIMSQKISILIFP